MFAFDNDLNGVADDHSVSGITGASLAQASASRRVHNVGDLHSEDRPPFRSSEVESFVSTDFDEFALLEIVR